MSTLCTVRNSFEPESCCETDIAVGAPFDGDGKVFIYRGSDAGIETKPAQVSRDPVTRYPAVQPEANGNDGCLTEWWNHFLIFDQILDGRDFDVRRFGYSISGGLDIDNNQYPDVAVGSLNDSVVLFR